MWISDTVVAWCFFGVSLIGAVFTLNAFVPVRRIPLLFVPSFFGSWLTAELALHHVAWQAVSTIVFVELGALSHWPGVAGLVITFASWLGLLFLFEGGRRTHRVFDQALGDLSGPERANRLPLSRLVMPFRFSRRGYFRWRIYFPVRKSSPIKSRPLIRP